MSFFTTTTNLTHRTALPPTTTLSSAISLLRNHDWLIRLDPELVSYTVDDAPANASPNTKFYTVTDHMDALPRGLWDTKVSFQAEITDLEDGIRWVIRAPLGLVQTSYWKIVGGEGVEGALALVEEVQIVCSRLLMGTVKGKCEENWRGIHGKFVAKLEEPAGQV